MNKKLSIKELLISLFVITFIILTSLYSGLKLGYTGWLPFDQKTENKYFEDFKRAYNIINKEYINDFDQENSINESINTLMNSLKDPYSYYINRDEYQKFLEEESNKFTGIGILYEFENSTLKILEVFPNSPAEINELKPGDIITKINNVGTENFKNELEVANALKGEVNTTIQLEIENNRSFKKMSIKRLEFESKSIVLNYYKNNIAYLKIYQFGSNTVKEYENIEKQIKLRGINNIIIDLRNNPGGITDIAYSIADSLINSGVIYQRLNKDSSKKIYYASGNGSLSTLKFTILVIVNRRTASSAELLATALKHNNGALIIGEKTKGKSSEQVFFEFNDGSAINLSTNKWLTPSGGELSQSESITPDIEVNDLKNGMDEVLQKALMLLD